MKVSADAVTLVVVLGGSVVAVAALALVVVLAVDAVAPSSFVVLVLRLEVRLERDC